MKLLTDIRELEGKTIARVCDNGDSVIMAFSDESFCFINGDWEGEDDGVSFSLARYYEQSDLYYVDLISHERFCEILEATKARQESRERQHYEKLRIKYDT